ncbi:MULTISPECIES: ABC transporter permease [Paenibacillus]|uniref:ABC transporter permease n=1 Tax=Paenibacillus violae TaxID=3077234 RepID=A0ABU3RD13_9BACL|nr:MULTISPECIES: ABC transporter permease [Paenibacillus]MDU0201717.1 ABC transporter permease [Paenibacillus sp. PFR10]MEC0268896.1 ABC transporter permease [Paenibacillus anseongense]
MLSYILRRCFYAIFVLFGVATVVFLITRLTGDPVAIMLTPDATAEQAQALRHSLGMDKPVIEQYGIYLLNLLHLDFGVSLRYGEHTLQLIIERMPATIQLAGAALLFSLVVAIPAGIISAIKRGTVIEKGIMSLIVFGQSMPVFWVGIVLVLLFSVHWRIFPTGGIGGFSHIVLPAFALGIHLLALVARLLRASLIEALDSDYIRTARAKGLVSVVVISKHALRNCLLPIITIVGLEIGALLGGSVVTETVFAWPGVGQLLVQSIYNRDYPLVQGAIIILAAIFVLVNLIVDICYSLVDPRIQYK